ncbi:glycosyltransferase [Clostridium sp. OS1-26]|uniref:glycosyltransferase n=1 Tax=Clostridium sp. OS1-26 TaxID=3070681 RepID=UPI0027E03A10|nr:glycosyltransferase [Clostridium sp. OS1-26]WML35488.1 glycosyltransferase [Clostridium sp. OS1-26]
MIVKNEEQNLRKCLAKASLFINEIIIVDTGSTDKTKEIAREFTDKIYNFKWCNNFSKARNYSIEKASNEWILVLDADEVIKEFDIKSIFEFINNDKNLKCVGRIEIVNLLEERSKNKKQIERVSRLFNKNYFQYKGIIHEQITALNGEIHNTELVNIAVEHIGYTEEALNNTKKLQRNIALLKKSVEDNPKDAYYLYQLGKSYYLDKQYGNSSNSFEKALSYVGNFNYEYVEDLVETYGYSLINNGKYAEALKLEKYREGYKKSADYNFLMGLIYMNNANFNEAVDNFFKCTSCTDGKAEGITSYLPCYNIGVIYECLGLKDESVKYYKMCKDYEPAIERLKMHKVY